MEQNQDSTPVKSIARATKILRVLAEIGGSGGALGDVAKASGFGKTTTHRILAALSEEGFTYQDMATRRYHLGAGLGLLARSAAVNEIGTLAQPVLMRLAEETEDTAYIQVREGLRSVCLGREQGAFPIRTLSLNVGQSRPLGVGSGGLAILGSLAPTEVEAVIEANRRWLADYPTFSPEKISGLVRQTRAQGYAFVEGLMIPGINAVAVPIKDAGGRPVASLNITAIAERIHGDRALWLAGLLREEAQKLSAALLRSDR
ncbi:IclR family transcriptional regulator [Hoeflea sp. Naph1]|uniref:IclR family transcriptional regulator n=1 Tax=Hoeflea sp. Naph1 TaxID=3388653 RepID=UPI00398FA366